jgi:hypothetical protein
MLYIFILTVGIKHRFRHILREPLKPQGQCYSRLNESISCYADACYTYTQKVFHDETGFRKIHCIRLDGLIVEGKHKRHVHMLLFLYSVVSFPSSRPPRCRFFSLMFSVILCVIKLFWKCLFSIKSNYELRTVTSYPKYTKLFYLLFFLNTW